MEPVTHFLSGAVLSRAGFNRRTAYATLAMTLAAEMPDLDVLWELRGPVAGLEHHRGITHTLLGAPFEALLLVGVVWCIHRLRRKPPVIAPNWPLLWLFSCVGVLLHILLDFTNNYGVRPFFPFDPHWYAWSIVFIVDPFLLLVFSLALVIPAIFALADREMSSRREPFRGQSWAVAALILVACYYAFRGVEHARAIELTRVEQVGVATENTSALSRVTRVAAEPYPIDPFHWHAIVETPDYFQTADVQTYSGIVVSSDQNDRIDKPAVTPAVAAAKRSWLGRVYLDWAAFPVTRDMGRELPPDAAGDPELPQTLTRVDFEDLRFAYSAIPGSNEGRPPLSASVYVAPNGEIEAMYIGDKPRK